MVTTRQHTQIDWSIEDRRETFSRSASRALFGRFVAPQGYDLENPGRKRRSFNHIVELVTSLPWIRSVGPRLAVLEVAECLLESLQLNYISGGESPLDPSNNTNREEQTTRTNRLRKHEALVHLKGNTN
nr:hypothetical protein Iba_chr13bCG12520 [Ipomoea batatas]